MNKNMNERGIIRIAMPVNSNFYGVIYKDVPLYSNTGGLYYWTFETGVIHVQSDDKRIKVIYSSI